VDRRAGKTSDPCHRFETAPPGSAHFCGCEHPLCPLIELRADCLPPPPNGILVDHGAEVRLFAPVRNPHRLSHSVARPSKRGSVIDRRVLSSSWSSTSRSPRRSASPCLPHCSRLRTSKSSKSSFSTRTVLHMLTAESGTLFQFAALRRLRSVTKALAPSRSRIRDACS